MSQSSSNECNRVRTLTGKEIELDVESDYKVRAVIFNFRRASDTDLGIGLSDQGEG